LIRWLTADGVTCSRAAAASNEPCSITAANVVGGLMKSRFFAGKQIIGNDNLDRPTQRAGLRFTSTLQKDPVSAMTAVPIHRY
jgi:hypothetical protein